MKKKKEKNPWTVGELAKNRGGWEQLGKQLPTLWNKKEFQKKGRGYVQMGSEGEVFLELGGENQLKLTYVTLMNQ